MSTRIVLPLTLTLLLGAACAPAAATPTRTAVPTVVQPSPTATALAPPAAAATPTVSAQPRPSTGASTPLGPGSVTTATPADRAGSRPAVRAAVAELASRLGMPEDRFLVERVEAVDWPDTSLGVPQPGQVYAQVITPGYRVILSGGDRPYELHTDSSGRKVVVKDFHAPSPVPSDGTAEPSPTPTPS